MGPLVRVACLCIVIFTFVQAEESGCIIELECPECLPDYMPLVSASAGVTEAAGGALRVAEAARVAFSCGAGRFAAFPLVSTLVAECVGGRYKMLDGSLRHLLDLSCQQDVIEDVLHTVEHCGSGLEGRAYRVQAGARVRHLAALCYDADRAAPLAAHVGARAALALPPHSDARAPLSLLANFNEMFDARTRHDADKLYSDEAKLNRRLHELLKPEGITLGEQQLTAASLLSPQYFAAQDSRAAKMTSAKTLVWKSVAHGNFKHLHADVAAVLRKSRRLHVYTGTHDVLALRSDTNRTRITLGSQGRFPVPRYLWTVVLDPATNKGLALIVLNDPLVAVSEIRESVFCDSMCSHVTWLHELMRHRNYEVPVLGLTFCCPVHNIRNIKEFSPAIVKNVTMGMDGALLEVPVD